MSYVELEQFLDRGSIRAWWGLSWRTFFGCAGGAVLGQQLGTMLYGSSMVAVATLTLVGAALGLGLLLKRRGIIMARRLAVLAAFGLRVATKRTVLDGALLVGRLDTHAPPPLQIRVHAPTASTLHQDTAPAPGGSVDSGAGPAPTRTNGREPERREEAAAP